MAHASRAGLLKGPRGEKCAKARLVSAQVIEMRKLWDAGGYSAAKLAEMFNVAESTAYFAATKRSWKHL